MLIADRDAVVKQLYSQYSMKAFAGGILLWTGNARYVHLNGHTGQGLLGNWQENAVVVHQHRHVIKWKNC